MQLQNEVSSKEQNLFGGCIVYYSIVGHQPETCTAWLARRSFTACHLERLKRAVGSGSGPEATQDERMNVMSYFETIKRY